MRIYCAIVAFLLLFSVAVASSVYELHLAIYKNDTVELKGFNVTSGSPGPFPDAGKDNNYEFRILSGGNDVLFNQSFHLGFAAYRFRGPNSTSPDVNPYNVTDDYWRLPYFSDAASVQLFHGGKQIFEYRLQGEQKVPSSLSQYINAASCAGLAVLAIVAFILFKKFSKPAKTGGSA